MPPVVFLVTPEISVYARIKEVKPIKVACAHTFLPTLLTWSDTTFFYLFTNIKATSL